MTQASCIVCECTDRRACPEGCNWSLVDRERGRGLCTLCAPLVEEAKQRLLAQARRIRGRKG